MTLSGYFMLKSVFGWEGCRALTFVLARLSYHEYCAMCICYPESKV